MSITARVSPGYALKMIIIAGVCLVMGVWGVYDYAVAIPRKQALYDRYHVLEATQDVLEASPADEDFVTKLQYALDIQADQLDALVNKVATSAGITPRSVKDPDNEQWFSLLFLHLSEAEALPEEITANPEFEETQRLFQAITEAGELPWLKDLFLFRLGTQVRRAPDQPLAGPALAAYERAGQWIDETGTVKKPGKFDRIIQWAFILCLPCAPYFLWVFLRAKKLEYRMDEDGTLYLPAPHGTWQADDIADIDMKKWLAKSIAFVIHKDGQQVKLDDYVYKNLYLIVGAIAHRFYPDEWTEEAKRVGSEEEEPEPLPDEEDYEEEFTDEEQEEDETKD